MRILVNTSTIVETGCTQVCVSFIYECIKHAEHDYYILLSSNVAKNINQIDFPENFHFETINTWPLYSFKARDERKRLRKLEKTLKPDCVFSVFGPSWWTPKAPHLMGYAFPYYVYPESPFYSLLTVKEKLDIYLKKLIHCHFLKRNGKYYVCETEDVSQRLQRLLRTNSNSIFTVSNTANRFFREWGDKVSRNRDDEVFHFYSLCSPKFHKNIQILNKVIPLLNQLETKKKIVFHTTFPQEKYESMFTEEVKPYIINEGLLPVAECPAFVSKCDALFLPTLMECFSASYPEAMCMGKPIVTSNLPFATGVCEDSALYFDPLNPEDIAQKLVFLVNDEDLYQSLVEKGRNMLKRFLTPEKRAERYLKILQRISSTQKQ